MNNIESALTSACPDVSVVHDEKDEGLDVRVELPGVSKDNVELTVSKNGFCLTAGRDDLRYEGCFQFAHDVNQDAAKAIFENGLLSFNVPFAVPLRGKKIAIL
jgi:HSP20 family molecular chaperone IbpA